MKVLDVIEVKGRGGRLCAFAALEVEALGVVVGDVLRGAGGAWHVTGVERHPTNPPSPTGGVLVALDEGDSYPAIGDDLAIEPRRLRLQFHVPQVQLPPPPPGMPDPVREPEAYLAWAKAQSPERRAEIEAVEAGFGVLLTPGQPFLTWAQISRRFLDAAMLFQSLPRVEARGVVFVVPAWTTLAGAPIPEGERSLGEIVEAVNAMSPTHTASCHGRELHLTARCSDVDRQPTSEPRARTYPYVPGDSVTLHDGPTGAGDDVDAARASRIDHTTDMELAPGEEPVVSGPTRRGYGRAKPAGHDRNRAVRARLGAKR